jgi:DNA-binding transcriptional LysR family regulator
MSKTLSQIRTAFHDQILIREGNQFVLTERGEDLKQQLPGLLHSLDNLYLPKTFDHQACERQFVFASSDYVAQFILPSICHKVAEAAPGSSVECKLWQKSWLDQLSHLPIDVMTTITETVPENLYGRKMAEDVPVIAMRANNPLAGKKLSLDDYVDCNHIVISAGGDKNSALDRELQKLDRQRKRFATVPFFLSAIELLLTSNAIITLPLHIAANFAMRHDLRLQPLPFEIKPHQYYILWHARHNQDPEHRWFREICYALSKEHLNTTIDHGMKIIQGR